VSPEVIRVVLSRRNLLALLAKLDGHPPESACTITFPGTSEEPGLVVVAEPDAVHYQSRPTPSGPMHPDTEAWIDEHFGVGSGR